MDKKEPADRAPFSVEIGKVLFVIVLVILFLLLAQSMVKHRFFRGGWQERNGAILP
jgi:hypothetical protein